MSKNNNEILEFQPFCGLHYTSESDLIKYSDNLDAFENKSFILNTYVNYFTNLCCSMFKVKGLPKDIDEQFVIRTLINKGHIAFFKTTLDETIKDEKGIKKTNKVEYPLMAQPFITTGRYNIYGKPTQIRLQSAPNCDTTFNGKTLNPDEFEIVMLNPMSVSLYPTIYYFCNKIVEVQRAIDVNIYSNQTPLIFEATQEQKTTVEQAIKKWARQVKHIILNKSTGARAEDLFKVHNTNVDWKADKMTDVMQYYKAEFYTMLGINHTPYEKRANMVRDEVRSNSHILRLTVDSMLDTMNECARRVNDKFGTEITFVYTLDSIYDTDIISEAESEVTSGTLTENEAIEKELKEAKLKSLIADGSKIDDYMFYDKT